MFGRMILLVLLLAWLTLFPIVFFLPQTLQTAILTSLIHCIYKVFYDNILVMLLQESSMINAGSPREGAE